ncbi:sensor histidine kinase [Fulvivirga kasyanovii]|uniref:sensor histidine kinase n=1 Tax=Fulvivirga kasyanovii TaxID=396812 RepID=UPI0031D4EC67
MTIIEKIPKIWKIAYLLICGWYAINYAVSSIIEWQAFRPYTTSVLWNGFYLFETVCILVGLTFIYTNWLFKFKVPVQVVGHLFGVFVYFMCISYLSYYFDYYLDGLVYFDDWKEYMLDLLSWDAMRIYDQYLITVAVYYIIKYFESLRQEEQEKSELALKNKEMELSLLRSQINPHFLFNTLNSISTLISTSKEKARKVITQLSDVFRYALDSHSGDKVRLIHELDFIENYIKIQQVRFGDRLKFELDVEPTCLSVGIPPMVLQPLVENSVKYGIAPKDEGGTIKLMVRRISGGIYFEIKDDGLGVNAKKVLDGKSTGVGLKNSDKRLRSIYGKYAGLHINARQDGYTVSFILPPEQEEQKVEPKRELEAVSA